MAVSDNSPSHSTFRQSLRELEVLLKQLNENSENQQQHNQVFFFKFQELEKQLEYLSEFERPVSNKFFIDSLKIHLFSNKLLTTDNTKLESFPPRLKEFLRKNEELLHKKRNQRGGDLQSLKWGFLHSYWILFIRMLYQYSEYTFVVCNYLKAVEVFLKDYLIHYCGGSEISINKNRSIRIGSAEFERITLGNINYFIKDNPEKILQDPGKGEETFSSLKDWINNVRNAHFHDHLIESADDARSVREKTLQLLNHLCGEFKKT